MSAEKDNPEDVKDWVETMLDEPVEGDLLEALRDGTRLCRIANKIQSNVAPFKQSKMPFVQMENIAAFLRACQGPFGVPHHELFETVDLHSMKNPTQVLITIRSLSRHAHHNDPNIPVLGPKLKAPSSPKKNTEFKREGQDIPAWNTRQYGYMGGASQGSEGINMGGMRQVTDRYQPKSPPSNPNIVMRGSPASGSVSRETSPSKSSSSTAPEPYIPKPQGVEYEYQQRSTPPVQPLHEVSSFSPNSPPAKPPKPLNLSRVRPVARPAGPRARPPVFGRGDEDESEESDDGKHIDYKRQALMASNKSKPSKPVLGNNEEGDDENDEDVYAYDEVYDTISSDRGYGDKPKQQEDTGPKYMNELLKSKQVRENDRLRAQQVKTKREREQEGDKYAGVETFVTKSYEEHKKNMEEAARLEEEHEEQQRRDGGMRSFYSTMIKRQTGEGPAVEETEGTAPSIRFSDRSGPAATEPATTSPPPASSSSSSSSRPHKTSRRDETRDFEQQLAQRDQEEQERQKQQRDAVVSKLTSSSSDRLAKIQAARERYQSRK